MLGTSSSRQSRHHAPIQSSAPSSTKCASFSSKTNMASSQSWSDEWRSLGLGARLPDGDDTLMTNLLFVQMGFGVDQHGNDSNNAGGSGRGATKAAVRAVRNAIEFNSIPGVIEAVPGGRTEMLISGELFCNEVLIYFIFLIWLKQYVEITLCSEIRCTNPKRNSKADGGRFK